eukprot:CAMPEP_0185757198 /NCGR_PEP_ID=MMETSP1174-20130828/15665_1 /TAXON_ID=35687 /ORGANISM="Dictyocha speculum, Strain CCMP1381" /LENGTH=143 /DNA_ID=CAMNT_0028436511 /DNA_START=176 /DNA_END=607 /DNA_ORIENTATION=+
MVNMLLVGPPCEKEFGSRDLFKIMCYVAVSSAVAHMMFGAKFGWQLGASGVVFALILLNSLLSARSGTVPLTFIITVMLWVGTETRSLFFSTDGISHIAHLSGAAVGTMAGYALHKKAAQERADKAAKSWFRRVKDKAKGKSS